MVTASGPLIKSQLPEELKQIGKGNVGIVGPTEDTVDEFPILAL